mmetsp:Transcript_99794/g.187750  ORF Transcript_99794/g.187750 Transcript_99794/m.187750 type:complete len:137 (+) Transcript_99794:1-411(+)
MSGSQRVLVYHNTFYDEKVLDMAYLDVEKVERLYNQGVDCMLRFLTAEPPSPDDQAAGIILKADPMDTLGGVAAVRDNSAFGQLAKDWGVELHVGGLDKVKWLNGTGDHVAGHRPRAAPKVSRWRSWIGTMCSKFG